LQCPKKELNLSKYEKILNRKIQLHFYRNFRKVSENLKGNIINGIVLDGYLDIE